MIHSPFSFLFTVICGECAFVLSFHLKTYMSQNLYPSGFKVLWRSILALVLLLHNKIIKDRL